MNLVNQEEFPCQRSRLPPVHQLGHPKLVPLVLHPARRVFHSYFPLEGEGGRSSVTCQGNTAVCASRKESNWGKTSRTQWHTLINTDQKMLPACYDWFQKHRSWEPLVSASVSGRSRGEVKNNLQGFRIIYEGFCNAVTGKMLNVSHTGEVLSGEYLSS